MRLTASGLSSALASLRAAARGFAPARGGGVAVSLAMAAPVLAIAVGMAIDYARFTDLKRKMQEAADAAALATAREMRLANNDQQRSANLARQFVESHLSGHGLSGYAVDARTVTPAASGDPAPTYTRPSAMVTATATPSAPQAPRANDAGGVDVTISMQSPGFFASLLGHDAVTINVNAQARATSSLPVCMIALDPAASRALLLAVASRLEAPGCSIYSDSVDSTGLSVTGFSALRSGFTCSSGGREGVAIHYSPLPQLDCPQVPDPLLQRPPPAMGACNFDNLVVSEGVRTLMPGVYCGGLKIDGSANVTFSPGEYVIKDGVFEVSGRAQARGSYTGFYLSGAASVLKFANDAVVELSAPKVGPMAGLLFFEDRAAAIGRRHEITSDNVRILLGTIYLSRGEFRVAALSRVGDQSSYTVVVARRVTIIGTPSLFLNIAYSATDVPVPEGLGPNGGAARLVR